MKKEIILIKEMKVEMRYSFKNCGSAYQTHPLQTDRVNGGLELGHGLKGHKEQEEGEGDEEDVLVDGLHLGLLLLVAQLLLQASGQKVTATATLTAIYK